MAHPIQGLNLNIRDAAARPEDPADIKRVGYCRFVYDVNNGKPNNVNGGESFDADLDRLFNDRYLPQQFEPALAFYDVYLQKCLHTGITPIVVFNHQTFGEGWLLDFAGAMQNGADQVTRDRWVKLSTRLAELIRRVAERYGDKIVYQIWNEQDQPSGSAVGVPPACYAEMLRVCAIAIASVSPNATVITGGFTSGSALAYWDEVQRVNPNVDSLAGLAVHPYDCGINTYIAVGAVELKRRLDLKIRTWRQKSPLAAKSIWITEFGCGGNSQLTDAEAAQYAKAVFDQLSTYGSGKIGAAVWFGWGDMNPAAGCYPVVRSAADSRVLWDVFERSVGQRRIPISHDEIDVDDVVEVPAPSGMLGAPPVPIAFNNQYELDTQLSNWRAAWSWASGGGGSPRWLRLLAAPDAPYSNARMRAVKESAKAVEDVITYLAPVSTKRYAPIRNQSGAVITSFCNIFVNDATRVLHCEIPNNPAITNVQSMWQWLELHGASAGWSKTLDGTQAQMHVNDGKVAVMIASTGAFDDHVALVRPGQLTMSNGFAWPRVAQVGVLNSPDVSSYATFSAMWTRNRTAVAFYLHD